MLLFTGLVRNFATPTFNSLPANGHKCYELTTKALEKLALARGVPSLGEKPQRGR